MTSDEFTRAGWGLRPAAECLAAVADRVEAGKGRARRVDECDRLAAAPTREQARVLTQRLLAGTRRIAHIWAVEDALDGHPELTPGQAWEVLEYVDHYKDCTLGITWVTLDLAAERLFGESAEPGGED